MVDLMASPSARSMVQPRADLPAAWISSTTAASGFALISKAATWAPWSAKSFAVAAPMPLPTPVTIATFPSIDRLSSLRLIPFPFVCGASQHAAKLLDFSALVLLRRIHPPTNAVSLAISPTAGSTGLTQLSVGVSGLEAPRRYRQRYQGCTCTGRLL